MIIYLYNTGEKIMSIYNPEIFDKQTRLNNKSCFPIPRLGARNPKAAQTPHVRIFRTEP